MVPLPKRHGVLKDQAAAHLSPNRKQKEQRQHADREERESEEMRRLLVFTSFSSWSRFSLCWSSFLLKAGAVLRHHLHKGVVTAPSQLRPSPASSGHSLGRPGVQHVGLQLGEEARLVAALTDPHVQQVREDGRVVDLHQPLLHGLSCTREAG